MPGKTPNNKRVEDEKQGGKSPRRKTTANAKPWSPHPNSPALLVPSAKAEHYPQNVSEILNAAASDVPGGYIMEGVLFAHVVPSEALDLENHIPCRHDSIYLHPETMKYAGLTIAQPVVIRNSTRKAAAICKPWPVHSVQLSTVALPPVTRLSCSVSEGDLISVAKMGPTSHVPLAHSIILEPRFSANFPLDTVLKSYLIHQYDGHFLCPGNILSVQFYGKERQFTLRKIVSPSAPSFSQQSSTKSVEDSVVDSLSNLSLTGATPVKVTMATVNEITSTPVRGSDVLSSSRLAEHGDGEEEEEEGVAEKTVNVPDAKQMGSAMAFGVCKVTLRTVVVFEREGQTTTTSTNWPLLSDVGGLKKQIEHLQDVVVFPLVSWAALESTGLKFPHGVLIHGPPGCGKTLLAKAIARETKVHCDYLSALSLIAGGHDLESKLQQAFQLACENSPSLVIVDELNILCPHNDHSPSDSERKATVAMATIMDQLKFQVQGHVVVLATATNLDQVNSILRRAGRFDKEVELTVPTAQEREEILKLLLRDFKHTINGEDLKRIAFTAHGHTGADLFSVCVEAQHRALQHVRLTQGSFSNVVVSVGDMREALRVVRPSAMKEVAVEVPKVLWSDIGGQEELKLNLRQSVEWPLKHPEAFIRLGIRPPRGVLLYGPPGCSKTMIARALATESGLNFIAVKGPELFSKWVGDSERAVRQVFSRARAAAPAIIFFDEIDALAVQRKGDGSAVADRVLAQMLTEMDGVERLDDVLVVAATNRPDLIDKALLRPGRIDRVVYVPLPNASTREEILKLQFVRMPVADDVTVKTLVESTEGFSGAEVVSLCQEAALAGMRDDMSIEKVCWRHFEKALQIVKPQTDASTLAAYERIHKSRGFNSGDD